MQGNVNFISFRPNPQSQALGASYLTKVQVSKL